MSTLNEDRYRALARQEAPAVRRDFAEAIAEDALIVAVGVAAPMVLLGRPFDVALLVPALLVVVVFREWRLAVIRVASQALIRVLRREGLYR